MDYTFSKLDLEYIRSQLVRVIITLQHGRNRVGMLRIAVSFAEKEARKCISDLTSRDSASNGERFAPRTVKFHPREQNNKFILAVGSGESGMQFSLAWILPARPSVSEQRISFHFPKAHHGHKFYVAQHNNRPKKEGGGGSERDGRRWAEVGREGMGVESCVLER